MKYKEETDEMQNTKKKRVDCFEEDKKKRGEKKKSLAHQKKRQRIHVRLEKIT